MPTEIGLKVTVHNKEGWHNWCLADKDAFYIGAIQWVALEMYEHVN